MSIPTQVALAPISEDLVNPMIRDAPDLNDEDSGKYYSLAATDPRLRPLGRRKRRSSNLPDWMNEEPFLRIRRFVENLGQLPGVYRRPLRWVLKVLRNISDIAYLISLAFILVILVGIIMNSRSVAIIGAAGVVIPNLIRVGISAASFVALPFLAGPVKGILFFIPPFTFYFLYRNWNRMKKAILRVVGPLVPIVIVVLIYAFVPSLRRGGLRDDATMAEQLKAGHKTVFEGIDKQIEASGVSVSGTVDDVVESAKGGVEAAKKALEERGVPVDKTIEDIKKKTEEGVESIKNKAKDALEAPPDGDSEK